MRPVQIPWIIHQYWDTTAPPDDVAERMRSWPQHHPGWAYLRWCDDSAYSTIEAHFGSRAARRFLACTIPAMRADVMRIAALLLFGGVYVDADGLCRQPLMPLLKARCTVQFRAANEELPDALMNNFMIAEPGHPLFRRAWEDIMANLRQSGRKGWRRLRKRPANNVQHVTGPLMLMAAYNNLSDKQRRSVRLVEPAEAARYVHLTAELSYHRSGSWKASMKAGRIVDFARADRLIAEREAAMKAARKEAPAGL